MPSRIDLEVVELDPVESLDGTELFHIVAEGNSRRATIQMIRDTVQAIVEQGQPNGYPNLDDNGKVPISQMYSATIGTVHVVADESEMLALTADVGDIAVRTDEEKRYMLIENDPSVLANWLELTTSVDAVDSVAGKTGNVVLVVSDVDGLQTALDAKSDVGHSHIIGDITDLHDELNDKSDVGHGHEIADINGLAAELEDDTFFTSSDTPPASPLEGERWYDTTSGIEYTRLEDQWVQL